MKQQEIQENSCACRYVQVDSYAHMPKPWRYEHCVGINHAERTKGCVCVCVRVCMCVCCSVKCVGGCSILRAEGTLSLSLPFAFTRFHPTSLEWQLGIMLPKRQDNRSTFAQIPSLLESLWEYACITNTPTRTLTSNPSPTVSCSDMQ